MTQASPRIMPLVWGQDLCQWAGCLMGSLKALWGHHSTQDQPGYAQPQHPALVKVLPTFLFLLG